MSDEDTVEVPVWAAEEAHLTLEHAIERTGGGDVGADEANSPLAEARDRVMNAEGTADAELWGNITAAFEAIAEERGVEISDADPLTDRTFRARNAFGAALEDDRDDGPGHASAVAEQLRQAEADGDLPDGIDVPGEGGEGA